ncbi:MAG TPA: hypothetical protein VM840_06035 [Actinomycetota bacterium]|nr:hypothetical protein [Actinomycetota bacterium]
MIALCILISFVVFGLALVRLSGLDLRPEERWVAGTGAGLALGTSTLYLVGRALDTLGTPAVAIWLAIVVLAAGLALRRRAPLDLRPPAWFLLAAGCLALALMWMNLYGVLAPVPDGVAAVEHIWADTPFHTSISTSFAHRDNLPPVYTIAHGQPLAYPFMVDLASGVLQRYGLGLRGSLIAFNLAFQLVVYLGLAVVARRVTGRTSTALAAVGLFFALGNLGWLTIPADVRAAGGFGAWLRDLPWSYAGDALGHKGRDRLGIGVYLGNPTFMFVMPRRAGGFGLATGMTILVLLDAVRSDRRWPGALLLGLVIGCLPRVHTHTALVMAVVAAAVAVRDAGSDPRRWRPWLLAGSVATLVALPQLLVVAGQAEGFFAWSPGWIGEAREALAAPSPGSMATVAWFWTLNAGPLLALGAIGLVRRPDLRAWYLPWALLWLIGNLVRTQPLEWDNTPWFVWWQAATCVLAGAALSSMWQGARPWRAVAVVCVVASTTGGLLSFAYGAQHRQFLWSHADLVAAGAVREHTAPDAVVLTAGSDFHGHPVNAISGRQVHSGWSGWLHAHGLDWSAYASATEAMYRGDLALMRELGVDHVLVGPYERGFGEQRGFDVEATLPLERLAPVWDRTLGGQRWTLYRVDGFRAPVGTPP